MRDANKLPHMDGTNPFHCANPECKATLALGKRMNVSVEIWVRKRARWEIAKFCRVCGRPPSNPVMKFIAEHYEEEEKMPWKEVNLEDFERGEYKEFNAEQRALVVENVKEHPEDFSETSKSRLEHCRDCKQEIYWLRAVSTGRMGPINAVPAEEGAGNIEIDLATMTYRIVNTSQRQGRKLHTSHFMTCPAAKKWAAIGKTKLQEKVGEEKEVDF